MKLKVFTAFSGYDSQCMALDRLGIDYELVGWSEIDKFAIQAHNAVYPQWADRNYGDISKIDWNEVPDFDLFTYSFPCTDISNAGQQKGLEKGSGTRSSLLWECQKAIEIKRPKYCMMENVAALASEKFLPYFLEWERLMCKYGYDNYNKILNSKHYGIAQNRERLFMVSIRGEQAFYWPEPVMLRKRLKDVLETEVDERFYLKEDKVSILKGKDYENLKSQKEVDETICLNSKVNGVQPSLADRIYSINGVMPCITTGYRPNIAVPLRLKQETKQGYIEVKPGSLFDGSFPESMTRRGRVQDGGQTSPTLTAGGEPPYYYESSVGYKIRKLTPKECFRLMGVLDSDIEKIEESGVSVSQQYKMAGNSIVVDVMVQIFRKMFVVTGQETQQLMLF